MENEKINEKQNVKNDKSRTGASYVYQNTFNFVVRSLSRQDRERILEGYDLKKFAKVFEDDDLMQTAECLFANDLNVSKTATLLYMHRNTLIYRLKKLKHITGLDLCNFYEAIVFKMLYIFYSEK